MTGILEARLLVSLQTVTIEALLKVDSRSWHCFRPSPAHQVEDLCHIEKQRDAGHCEHEDDEDGLLCGSRHEALHGEGTGVSGADDSGYHDEPVQIVLPHNEAHLQEDSEKDGGHVGSQQVASNLDVAFFVSVLGTLDDFTSRVGLYVFSQLFFFVDHMEGVTEVDQRWR